MNKSISEEYRRDLHRILDKAIDDLKGGYAIEVTYGTRSAPNERTGMMETRPNGVVTITVAPSNMRRVG